MATISKSAAAVSAVLWLASQPLPIFAWSSTSVDARRSRFVPHSAVGPVPSVALRYSTSDPDLPDYGSTSVDVDQHRLEKIDKWRRRDLDGKSLVDQTMTDLENDADFLTLFVKYLFFCMKLLSFLINCFFSSSIRSSNSISSSSIASYI